ncbi:hypothetical protein ACQCSX_22565 (plasmid) [Pseudarthrobacter sp. P1]|uniref:hypothetical protein n=1 Tax=Pseudarthrobacter sp. P1 TaxID=3418418 RepID=UPI003CECBE60
MNAKHNAAENAAKRFRTETADHVMEVALDQGLYRHLRFRNPGTGFCWFEIITTPGQLTIRGDMGTYVFARTEDMFAFFEGSGGRTKPSYWAEKVQAQDIHSPVLEYSRELFIEHVLEEFWDSRENLEDAPAVWAEIRDQLLDDVYGPAGDETIAITAAMEFNVGGFEFYDVTDWRLKAYNFHYLYSLHAIVDGIRRYRDHVLSLQLAEAA